MSEARSADAGALWQHARALSNVRVKPPEHKTLTRGIRSSADPAT